MTSGERSTGLADLLAGDGRLLLAVTGLALALAGGFALFTAARGEFLPHDVAYLRMMPEELCSLHECRIVHFMVHDRVSFGGALVALGTMYLWLVAGPLTRGEWWAWQLLAVNGMAGFLSFLAYLGYGYLDTWHGAATGALFPVFVAGLVIARRRIAWGKDADGWRARPARRIREANRQAIGRMVLCVTAFGMAAGGATILVVGMTIVFVPEDVAYLGVGRTELTAINPRLVPLIAHDRAGFGGVVCCCGMLLGGVAWRADFDRALGQALAVAGLFGFGTAVLIHPVIGYDDWWHLTPAVVGTGLFAVGWWLARPRTD